MQQAGRIDWRHACFHRANVHGCLVLMAIVSALYMYRVVVCIAMEICFVMHALIMRALRSMCSARACLKAWTINKLLGGNGIPCLICCLAIFEAGKTSLDLGAYWSIMQSISR